MTAQPSSQAEREDVALLPCPFCGRADKLENVHDGVTHWIVCRHCGCDGPVAQRPDHRDALWNRRPDREHATPRSMPEEVVEAYERAAKVVERFIATTRASPFWEERTSACLEHGILRPIQELIPGASA